MIPVQVVGLGMSPDDLTPRALEVIREAQVLVGGRRLLAYFPDHPARKILLGKDPADALGQLSALAAELRVVVLASGDPNFYGVGPLVLKLLGPEQVVVHPNITAVQAACARLKMAWQDATVVSLHGRSFQPLAEALGRGFDRVLVYTDAEHTPGAIARWLLARGQGDARLCVLEDLGQEAERLTWLSPREARGQEFSPLNLVVILPAQKGPGQRAPLHLGLPEEALSRQGGLITKAEVRAVVLAKLALAPGLTLWDLGAGCGSVSLEASLLLPGGRIIAVEQDQDRANQIRANLEKFGVTNLEVVWGRAPACLADLPAPQRVFIGGGGRDLGEILPAVLGRLEHGDERVVLTATLLDTLEIARKVLAAAGWRMEVTLLQVSRSRPLGGGTYMQAQNPVWIVSGWAGEIT